ncbi:MAG TPA: hypothetical protein VGG38_16435 [Acidimicrobiales bacterium]|jgi:hypothetical protein
MARKPAYDVVFALARSIESFVLQKVALLACFVAAMECSAAPAPLTPMVSPATTPDAKTPSDTTGDARIALRIFNVRLPSTRLVLTLRIT